MGKPITQGGPRPQRSAEPRTQIAYFMLPQAVASDRSLSSGAKVLLAVVFSLAAGPWKRCFASNEKLADMTGLSTRQVLNLLRSLEEKKMLERIVTENKRLEIRITCTCLQGKDFQGGMEKASMPVGKDVPPYKKTQKRDKESSASPGRESEQGAISQNYNPPMPVEPDPDPERTAQVLALDWRNWAKGGGE